METEFPVVNFAESPTTTSIDYETIKCWLKALYNFRFCKDTKHAKDLLNGSKDSVDAWSVIGGFRKLFQEVLEEYSTKPDRSPDTWASLLEMNLIDYQEAKAKQEIEKAAQAWKSIMIYLDVMSPEGKKALSEAFTTRLSGNVQIGIEKARSIGREGVVIVLIRPNIISAYEKGPTSFGKCGNQEYTADAFDKVIFTGPAQHEMNEHVMGALQARIRELGA